MSGTQSWTLLPLVRILERVMPCRKRTGILSFEDQLAYHWNKEYHKNYQIHGF